MMYLVLFLSYLIVLLCCLLVGEYIFLTPPLSHCVSVRSGHLSPGDNNLKKNLIFSELNVQLQVT